MNRLVIFLLISSAGMGIAQTPQLHPGATVYIEPMGGYETYLAAAIAKKEVPLIVVIDPTKADYVITSTLRQHSPIQPAVVVNNTTNANGGGNDAWSQGWNLRAARTANRGSTSASISVVDAHSSEIVFAYSVGKSSDTNQIQRAAEACVKHLKDFTVKPRH